MIVSTVKRLTSDHNGIKPWLERSKGRRLARTQKTPFPDCGKITMKGVSRTVVSLPVKAGSQEWSGIREP